MKFIEWLFKVPRRVAESEFAQMFAGILVTLILLVTTLWYLVRGPQILALIPIIIALYIIYYVEERDLL